MDIDGDLVSGLLQQFSCLGTTDKDVLVSQFQKLLGDQLNPAGCAFFLEMNNWNLQAAVCSYFEYADAPKEYLPRMSFVRDVTIGEGEAVPPGMKFVKTWKIHNPSDDRWPPGCCLRFTAGDHMGEVDRVLVDALEPRSETDVSVEMTSPLAPGIYQGQWRMSTATGQFFGEVIWVIVTVAEGGVLSLTQQMDAFHQLGSPPRTASFANPFATPTQHTHCKFAGPTNMEESEELGDQHSVLTNGENSFTDAPFSHEKESFHSSLISTSQSHENPEQQFLTPPNENQNCRKHESTNEEMIS